MSDEGEQLDDRIASLAETLRAGDLVMACLELAEVALELDRAMHREERALELLLASRPATPPPLTHVRREHGSLRRLVGGIAGALDAGDEQQGLDQIGKLRSVLLVHLAKEERLQPLLARAAADSPA
ncbi:MAG: hemerythrin domain-containing protein [Myxococcales bacterium]|nr:hemerythrin domain-containing protein [Myxococcales bacterium]